MGSDAEIDAEKRLAAEAAAELVEDGMRVGLGTGSTVAHLLPALAARGLALRCVATSPETDDAARELGLHVVPFADLDRLEIAIDGADQVTPDGWLVKGGGGAHTREKIVAAAAERFVVIVDSTKPVEAIQAPIPLELHRFGLQATLRELGEVELRDADPSPDDGLIPSGWHGYTYSTVSDSTSSPRAISTSATNAGGNSPCSTTPGVSASRIAIAIGSRISPV